jgi:hypothetical protein
MSIAKNSNGKTIYYKLYYVEDWNMTGAYIYDENQNKIDDVSGINPRDLSFLNQY